VPQSRPCSGDGSRPGHLRRYDQADLKRKLTDAGFTVEALRPINSAGILGWFLNVRLLRRTRMSKVQLKIFDSLVPVLRTLEAHLKLPGLSLIAVGRPPPSSRTTP